MDVMISTSLLTSPPRASRIPLCSHAFKRPGLPGAALHISSRLNINKRRREALCRSCRGVAVTSAATSADRSTFRLIQLTLRKPMGLVLEDNPRNRTVFVAEIVPGGNADQSGKVQVGDILTKCSATVLKDGKEGEYEKEGYGKRLYTNWTKVMFSTEGEDFDTVMKAIASNTERWGIFDVDLELKRYLGEQQY